MRIFSGVKPSGDLHIGNYLGAIRQFVKLQNENEGIFCVVDLHAITVPQDPELLRKRSLDIAITYIAMGIDPDKSTVFIQSHVSAHAELGWILNTFTPVGELERMTQYKDAVAKGRPNFGGLLNYPTLMAADILLYKTEGVPVGDDQVQHIELTRSIAERFNNKFGETFVVPKALVMQESARVMSLLDPEHKMAKSEENPDTSIGLLDTPDEIRAKIKRAMTDSNAAVQTLETAGRGLINLASIYSGFADISLSEVFVKHAGENYGEFKEAVTEAVIAGLTPFQQRYNELQKEKSEVLELLKRGAEKASAIANPMLKTVKEKIGFLT